MNNIKHICLTIICALLFSTITIAHGGKKMDTEFLYEEIGRAHV